MLDKRWGGAGNCPKNQGSFDGIRGVKTFHIPSRFGFFLMECGQKWQCCRMSI